MGGPQGPPIFVIGTQVFYRLDVHAFNLLRHRGERPLCGLVAEIIELHRDLKVLTLKQAHDFL